MDSETLLYKYRELFISISVGILAAVGDLLLGAFEEGDTFMVHIAKHGGLTSIHMIEHYFFIVGSIILGLFWWKSGHGYRKEKDERFKEMEQHRKYVDQVADSLRNPLQAVKGHLELFERGGLTSEQEKQFDKIADVCGDIETNIKKLTKGPENDKDTGG